MFKNIDKKFEEIGFIKTKENEYQVIYERENEFSTLLKSCAYVVKLVVSILFSLTIRIYSTQRV